MTHQPSKMLIEAGIIPKNTLQQLANWRLLPEDCIGSHGVRPVRLDTNDPRELERFVSDLSVAITKDMAEIRETELDRSGCYRKAQLQFKDSKFNTDDTDVFVDRLGRLVVPDCEPWPSLLQVRLDGSVARQVVKQEPRYEGDKVVATVIYLESKEDGDV